MLHIMEEAIIYATIMYQGKLHEFRNTPFILHPLEVAQILSTMSADEELITAGILHGVVDDTVGTLEEIEKRFGKRAAFLVSSVSDRGEAEKEPDATWKQRREESLRALKNSADVGVKMLRLADTLADIRALAGSYSERGEELWQTLAQSDSAAQCWYYRSVAEYLELSLNRTGAFKELIKHINFIWPGTFDSDKARYRKYREVSVDGCELLGRGAKGEVYRYDDELVIKVFNQNNTYRDVEREIALSRRAFILGVPTAISFGIVSVGDRYGAMFELVDSETVSRCIARAPGQVKRYAKIMAELAHAIHSAELTQEDDFPEVADRLRNYVNGGIALEDEALAAKCMRLIDALPPTNHLVHGDFHTNNVFLQKGEALLIDMDRLSRGNPIAEIADLYYFYVVLGEDDASVVEDFMGFSYETSQKFFSYFLQYYLGTEDEGRLNEVTEKAALLCYVRMINKLHKKGKLSAAAQESANRYREKLAALTRKLDTLAF